MDREQAYEDRLAEMVSVWEKKKPTEAHELREKTRRVIGMIRIPQPGSMMEKVLERAYREEVRKLHPKWPSLNAWMRGE